MNRHLNHEISEEIEYDLDLIENFEQTLMQAARIGPPMRYRVRLDKCAEVIPPNTDPTQFSAIYSLVNPRITRYVDIDVYRSDRSYDRTRYVLTQNLNKTVRASGLNGDMDGYLSIKEFNRRLEEKEAQAAHKQLVSDYELSKEKNKSLKEKLTEAENKIWELEGQLEEYESRKFHIADGTNIADVIGMVGSVLLRSNTDVLRQIPGVGPGLAGLVERAKANGQTGEDLHPPIPQAEEEQQNFTFTQEGESNGKEPDFSILENLEPGDVEAVATLGQFFSELTNEQIDAWRNINHHLHNHKEDIVPVWDNIQQNTRDKPVTEQTNPNGVIFPDAAPLTPTSKGLNTEM